VSVYARIFGLSPGTTYYYRLLAENEGGKGKYGDQEGAFTTSPALSTAKPGPTTTATTSSVPPPGPSTSEVATLIAKQLIPSGRTAAISSLLKHGLFGAVFKAPEAGTAVIYWYYLPRGAKLAKASRAPAPVLVASGKLTFKSATKGTIELHLSTAGKRLLRHASKIRLTAKCVFTPTGKAAITMLKTFELKR
jgi:hypothetical protein